MAFIMQNEDNTLYWSSEPNYVVRKVQEVEQALSVDVIKATINEQGQVVMGKQLPLPARLAKYLSKTRTDDVIEVINALLSFILTLFFALDTYYDGTPIVIEYAEYVVLILHTLDFVLLFFISYNRLFYILSLQSVCSYLTIIPTFLVRAQLVTDTNKVESLLLCRVFRFLSILRLDNVFARRSMTLARAWFRLLYTFVATVIIFAALILTVENSNIRAVSERKAFKYHNEIKLTFDELATPGKEYEFHDMLYFLIITVTTVGYGDIYPHTLYGQMLSIVIIFVMLSLIPKQFSELSKVNSLISVYARKSYSPKGKSNAMHILLLGDAPPEAIKTFFSELFHSDHGFSDTHLVLMRPNQPSEELKAVIKSSSFESRVSFIEGNAIFGRDLKRCLAERAKCCIILSNQFCQNPHLEDQRNILSALAVKKYVRAHGHREIRTCLQLVKPENKSLYFCALQRQNRVDQVLCSEELKLQLLAKSSICPGIITIIWSLITSNPTNSEGEKYDSPEEELRAINEKMKIQREVFIAQQTLKIGKLGQITKESNVNAVNDDDNPAASQKIFEDPGYLDENGIRKEKWQVNYESGTNYELYRILLKHEKFEGLRFKDVCMILFHKLGLVLIAIEVKVLNQVKVFVNPSEYLIDSNDYYGYVIFHENPDSDQINGIDISKHSAENFAIMEYITKQEQTMNKREFYKL